MSHIIFAGNIQFNDVVVVSGCGPLGLGMVAAAKQKSPVKLVALDLYDWKVNTKMYTHSNNNNNLP